MEVKDWLEQGKGILGIEFGSTRIKAVLIGEHHEPVASGSFGWENRLEDGVWTYRQDDIWNGLQQCYKNLQEDVQNKYGIVLKKFASIGFSAMMHGYLAFDAQNTLLVPFRTWRNTMTEQAAEDLTKQFAFNIPQRWSIAHLYQAILNKEEHVADISYITTLAGYVHWMLTGEKVLGVGDASGMFPIDSETIDYDVTMLEQFEALVADKQYGWKLQDILPKVLRAGENAGQLTQEGAKLLDPSGNLQAGIPLCPPEGDAGTGMTATNSVAVRTGNVSAGTSVFAMVVLEKALKQVHMEIDMVTTPSGEPVAMVHCNNCTSDINAWAGLFRQFAGLFGMELTDNELFTKLFEAADRGAADCGGLLSYNYFSGEGVTAFDQGRPLFVRQPDAAFTLENFMRTHLYSALATLKVGLDILREEQVQIDNMYGHGGFFTTKGVGQSVMAAAMDSPVSVMETAGEGGAWGIALLAAYMTEKTEGESLAAYLQEKVFAGNTGTKMEPDAAAVEGFRTFLEQYKKGLAIEKAATEQF